MKNVMRNQTINIFLQKYREVFEHSIRVRDLATSFAIYLGYEKDSIRKIYLGSYLHDIGKSFIDESILFKKGKLMDEEYDIIKNIHC